MQWFDCLVSKRIISSLSFTSDDYFQQKATWQWQHYDSDIDQIVYNKKGYLFCYTADSEIFDFEHKKSGICYDNFNQIVYTAGGYNAQSFRRSNNVD